MRLRTISPEAYAHDILPVTASLWAGARDLPTYKRQTSELAHSTYGRRHYRTIGLFDGGNWLASCKRYQRTIQFEGHRLQGVGFGAVFTPSRLRGRGYATTMLAMLMDEAKAQAFDVAYLFSDIRPAFYRVLGFKECPSSVFAMRSDSLTARRLRCSTIENTDWRDIAKCFRLLQSQEAWGLERSPAVWDFIRLRIAQRSEHRSAQMVALVLRAKRRVIAYVIGQRQPQRDILLLDEFGWANIEGRSAIPTLLRSAAGDLRRITGWLPPASARVALPRITRRPRKTEILMVAALSKRGTQLAEVATRNSASDAAWASDHI